MAKKISRKVRLALYALIVLFLGGGTGWATGSGKGDSKLGVTSVPKAYADIPGDGGSPGSADGCPSPTPDCCD